MAALSVAAPWYRWDGADLVLRLRVQPRAAKDAVVGPHGDRLRVRLAAPPVDGKANARLLAFLAELCAVPRAQVELLAGEAGRDKTVRIAGPRALPPGVDR